VREPKPSSTTKSASASLLADVVRRVHCGGRYVDPDLAVTALTAEDSR
jgi:two-component system response regulator DesR